MIIRWLDSINKHILDDVSITIGNKIYVEDKADSGKYKKRRLVRNYPPEEYTLNMEFDWADTDDDGNSEFSRFMNWYQYEHKRGVNPFEFPSIRRYSKTFNTETGEYEIKKEKLRYRITSPLNIQKHGYKKRISMTWIEDYPGHIHTTSVAPQWRDDVNMRVLDSTTVNTSDGGVIDTAGPNGEFSERHLNEEFVPDTYNVTMDFDWEHLDADGKSEFDRFCDWFIFGHKLGTVSFEMPSMKDYRVKSPYRCWKIIKGEKTFITEAEYILGKTSAYKENYFREYRSDVILDKYKITSPVKAVKSGFYMRCTMTMENVVTQNIEEPKFDPFAVDHIEVDNGILNVIYTDDVQEVNKDLKLYYGTTTELSEIPLNYDTAEIDGKVVSYKFNNLPTGDYYISLHPTYSSSSSLCSLLGVK